MERPGGGGGAGKEVISCPETHTGVLSGHATSLLILCRTLSGHNLLNLSLYYINMHIHLDKILGTITYGYKL